MIKSKKLRVYSLFTIMAVSIIIQLAEATTMNFNVHGGEEEIRSINLAVDDHVVIKFTVLGQTANTLNFRIEYPDGTAKDFGKVGTLNYPFVCEEAGEYVLNFSNADSSEDKLVTLDYEIEHYIFGIPQMLFLTIIIVLVCMAAVASFILMGKPR
jgi:hypothetical protein